MYLGLALTARAIHASTTLLCEQYAGPACTEEVIMEIGITANYPHLMCIVRNHCEAW